MPIKPKTMYSAASSGLLRLKDLFQTPSYALDPLIPYLHANVSRYNQIYEPCAGEGYLARALHHAGYNVCATDLQLGVNFFDLAFNQRCVVTNVPFALKYAMLRYALSDTAQISAFALLMPSDVIDAGKEFQPLMERYNLQMLKPDKRIAFKTPLRGWQNSSPQMHCSWVCYNLNLPERVTFCKIDTTKEELPLDDLDRVCPEPLDLDPQMIDPEDRADFVYWQNKRRGIAQTLPKLIERENDERFKKENGLL